MIRCALCLVIQTETHKQNKKKVEKSRMFFSCGYNCQFEKDLILVTY